MAQDDCRDFQKQWSASKRSFAAGGIAEKNTMMMQIYSDVLDMDIKFLLQNTLGSAMLVLQQNRGGYDVLRMLQRYGPVKIISINY
jgi:ribulose kinase